MKRVFSAIRTQADTPHCLVLLAPCPSKTVLRFFLDPKRGAANKDL